MTIKFKRSISLYWIELGSEKKDKLLFLKSNLRTVLQFGFELSGF